MGKIIIFCCKQNILLAFDYFMGPCCVKCSSILIGLIYKYKKYLIFNK
jgi:hypothetical protein